MGAGKSTIAHTIAQRCYKEGLLAASFFFDRSVAGRNEPKKLFSTIARSLADFDAELGNAIASAIEADHSIATAPITRQFDELIRQPISLNKFRKPIVIVIDALDEGYDDDLLSILAIDSHNLPDLCRLFITSRPESSIVDSLSQNIQIREINIDVHEQSNLSDIAAYARDRLRDIASRKRLSLDWPGNERTEEFITRAEGLFIWVTVFSRYLRDTTHPDKKLKLMLERSAKPSSGVGSEKLLDNLYASILATCDWDDEDFVEGYHMFMGAIIAAKTPLSTSALQSLHRTSEAIEATEVVGRLRSVLVGHSDPHQPIQLLHISLHEFLTVRSPTQATFYLDKKDHSRRLALLCLAVLNEDLKEGLPGTGYLKSKSEDIKGIPNIPNGTISEEIFYACEFWISHLKEIEEPTPELITALRNFLTDHLIEWLELMASMGQFRFDFLEWMQVSRRLSNASL